MGLLLKITMTCRKATLLSARAAEGTLRGIPWLRYRLHMVICAACKRFSRQADSLCKAGKSAHENHDIQCPDHLKKSILEKMRTGS